MKVVVVTGASGGIGRTIAVQCARDGYYVVCHYNHGKENAGKTLDLVKKENADGELLQCDIANRDECREKFEELLERLGAPWGVVCNAGIANDNTFAGLSGDDWDCVVHTNLDGFFNVLNPFILPMCRKKCGRIITMSSVSGIIGNRGQTNYAASKAGLIGASKSLAVELASRNITVNCIAPGIIETEMSKDAPLEEIIKGIPMKRAGKPEEVASLASFLLSENASYITRQVISVNGGLI